MTDLTEEKSANEQKIKWQNLKLPRAIRWLREALAIATWGLIFVQLFVYDMGTDIVGSGPILESLFRYRFLVLLGIIAVSWTILGNRRFVLFFGYIFAYPFVLLFWIVPRTAFRNWAVMIAFSPAIHSIFTSFRTSFVFFALAVISAFIIFLASDRAAVSLGMLFLAAFLVYHFVRRFRVAFSASTVFSNVGRRFQETWDRLIESEPSRPPDGLDPGSEEYKQKLGSNLLILYSFSTAMSIVAKRVREVMDSRKLDLYLLASMLYTFVITIIVFAIEYLSLERILPGSFSGISDPGFLDFLGFSFSTIMTADLSPIRPATEIAQAMSYVQLFGSLLIIVLLVFVLLTSIRERYRDDLDDVASEASATSDRIGGLLESNFDLTLAATEALLLEINPIMAKWILKIRHGEERAKAIERSVLNVSESRNSEG